jgi:hypothetical protein
MRRSRNTRYTFRIFHFNYQNQWTQVTFAETVELRVEEKFSLLHNTSSVTRTHENLFVFWKEHTRIYRVLCLADYSQNYST